MTRNEVTQKLDLFQIFNKGESYFLTWRDPKRQKLDDAVKKCKALGDTFLVVRESDHKEEGGYHFHAVIKKRESPKPSFFKKGVHTHLKNARTGQKVNARLFTKLEVKEILETPEIACLEEHQECEDRRFMQRIARLDLQSKNVKHALDYCQKEFVKQIQFPRRYENYALVIRKKHCDLPGLGSGEYPDPSPCLVADGVSQTPGAVLRTAPVVPTGDAQGSEFPRSPVMTP